tara:strand:- start:42 stop:929 length:888 start_codon:yes stop_codon:yes gene_type:complete
VEQDMTNQLNLKTMQTQIKKISNQPELINSITFEEVLITPEYAERLLKLNKSNNRALSQSKVLQYTEDMISGNWKSGTGETIKISKTNVFIDGQHRLRAIILSGVSVLMHISRGHEVDVFTVLDTGKPRGASDVLSIDNISNASQIAALIRACISMSETGLMTTRRIIPNREILNLYNENPIFWQGITKKASIWYNSFSTILSKSIIGTMYVSFSKIDIEKSDLFFDQLCGVDTITNSTINVLRNKLIYSVAGSKRIPMNAKVAMIIKTWNAFRKNKEIVILKYDPAREDYPKAI